MNRIEEVLERLRVGKTIYWVAKESGATEEYVSGAWATLNLIKKDYKFIRSPWKDYFEKEG